MNSFAPCLLLAGLGPFPDPVSPPPRVGPGVRTRIKVLMIRAVHPHRRSLWWRSVVGQPGDDPVVIDLAARVKGGGKRAWDALVERYAPTALAKRPPTAAVFDRDVAAAYVGDGSAAIVYLARAAAPVSGSLRPPGCAVRSVVSHDLDGARHVPVHRCAELIGSLTWAEPPPGCAGVMITRAAAAVKGANRRRELSAIWT